MTMVSARATHHSVPLMRLLWKEFRERRWWAIAWALLILAISLFAHGQQFCGETNSVPVTLLILFALPVIFAGVVGLGGYTAELQRGRAYFLFTRAVRWQEVLFTKVLFGMLILLCVPLLAAGIFRLTCPEPYRHLVTLPNVLIGVGILAWPSLLSYLCGLACSVILPGIAGETLTVTCVGIIILLTLLGSEFTRWLCDYFNLINYYSWNTELKAFCIRVGILSFAALGILWGGVSVTHSGLYRHYLQRIKLFAPKFIIVMIIGGFIGLCLPSALAARLFLHWFPLGAGSISPGGSYAIREFQQRCSFLGIDLGSIGGESTVAYRQDVIRVADDKVVRHLVTKKPVDIVLPSDWYWITDTIAMRSSNNGTQDRLLYHPVSNTFVMTTKYPGTPSPNGHLAVSILAEPVDKKYNNHRISFWNLDNGHSTSNIFILNKVHKKRLMISVWWVSDDTIGYYSVYRDSDKSLWGERQIHDFHEEVHYLHVPKF